MKVEILDVDSDGAVFKGSFEGEVVGSGMSATLGRMIQAVLASVADGSLAPIDTLKYNTVPEQNPFTVMFGGAKELEPVEREFKLFNIGVHPDRSEEGDYVLLIAEEDGHHFFAFGPMTDCLEHTSEKCPEGGVNAFPVADEDWAEFVEAFLALTFED